MKRARDNVIMSFMDKRNKGALVTLAVGLALNIILGVAKLVAGVLSDSMSVSSDALNNLSDAAVSVVTIIATALSVRRADHDHPYGHGRYEYIATFILGAVIVAVGVEVLIGGVKRAITPVDVAFDIAVWVTLSVSVAVKGFMTVFYTVRGKKANSEAILAAAVDSGSDAAVTSVVLVCAVIEKYTGAHIDGYVSIGVAVVILVFAVKILRGVINRLLGSRPDPELVQKIYSMLEADENVISVHDLVIHDYGAAKKIAEADAVFPADMTFIGVHSVCDELEREVSEKTGVKLSIHADPHIVDDVRLVEIRERISNVLERFNASAHDIKIDDVHKKVELDVKLPDDGASADDIKQSVCGEVSAVIDYSVDIDFDYI